MQSTTDVAKINFVMTYITKVAQNQFEIKLDQEEQEDQLEDWFQFLKELQHHFGLSNPIRDTVVALDNLQIKTGNRIVLQLKVLKVEQ